MGIIGLIIPEIVGFSGRKSSPFRNFLVQISEKCHPDARSGCIYIVFSSTKCAFGQIITT
jgi:hypothetical protein